MGVQVGVPANSMGGGSICEADGSRAADASHATRDPARGSQADATRQAAFVAVPDAPTPWLALLAPLLPAADAYAVRQPRRA